MGQILAVSFLSRFRVSQIPSQSVSFPQLHFAGTSVLVYRVGINNPVNTPFVIDPASSTGVSIRLPISNIKKTTGSSARTRSCQTDLTLSLSMSQAREIRSGLIHLVYPFCGCFDPVFVLYNDPAIIHYRLGVLGTVATYTINPGAQMTGRLWVST
jgi:hypothetical protein